VNLYHNLIDSDRGPNTDAADRDRRLENNLTKALITGTSLSVLALLSVGVPWAAGARLDGPTERYENAAVEVSRFVLRLTKEGALSVNGEVCDLERLKDRLVRANRTQGGLEVTLEANAETAFTRVRAVLDALRQSGCDRISLQVPK
jgi:biopolymer transport protein ExbD